MFHLMEAAVSIVKTKKRLHNNPAITLLRCCSYETQHMGHPVLMHVNVSCQAQSNCLAQLQAHKVGPDH